MIIGIVNIIKGGDPAPSSSGNGDLIAGGVLLVALAAAGVAIYHALEGALLGVRDTTAEANTLVAWLIGGAVALAVVAATGWWLFNRWRDRRDGLTSTPADVRAYRAHCLEVATAHRAALEARQHTERLEAEDRAELGATPRQRVRARATRLDRDTTTDRQPVDLDALGGDHR